MVQFSLREIAASSFGLGIIGLSVAIPGYLSDWNEYLLCTSIAGFKSCTHRAYSFQEPQPPGIEPIKRYFAEPLTKALGIGFAVIAFPIAGYASREMAESKEFNETVEAVDKIAALDEHVQQRTIDNKINADAYEAMKSYELADAVDRFRETFRQEITVDDIEAQLEAEQQRLQQVQNYKALEFQVEKQQRQWSPEAQNFYAWLMSRPELPDILNSDWLGKQSFDGKKLNKEQWIPLVEQIVAEGLAQWIDAQKSFRIK
ncbi:hypothetical protein [Iningainema tapete]|uniref:Uncharacterized protein n=1 Tax=Iningainema tapete BLCC-T55 TaxID=2748662 RepID=A0A8J7CE18_9CYAN|nr:hypothetical protein [Iningainema tapete]MBD2773190.1 hypothetical protein [Iningainema tapete BLCC-T55]